jgi:hypothetical protein
MKIKINPEVYAINRNLIIIGYTLSHVDCVIHSEGIDNNTHNLRNITQILGYTIV